MTRGDEDGDDEVTATTTMMREDDDAGEEVLERRRDAVEEAMKYVYDPNREGSSAFAGAKSAMMTGTPPSGLKVMQLNCLADALAANDAFASAEYYEDEEEEEDERVSAEDWRPTLARLCQKWPRLFETLFLRHATRAKPGDNAGFRVMLDLASSGELAAQARRACRVALERAREDVGVERWSDDPARAKRVVKTLQKIAGLTKDEIKTSNRVEPTRARDARRYRGRRCVGARRRIGGDRRARDDRRRWYSRRPRASRATPSFASRASRGVFAGARGRRGSSSSRRSSRRFSARARPSTVETRVQTSRVSARRRGPLDRAGWSLKTVR